MLKCCEWRARLLSATALIAICPLSVVHAQSALTQPSVSSPGQPTEPPVAPGMVQQPEATTTSTTGLQEIVVTAQKRSENLQNVPISVTAVGGNQIAQLHAATLQGLNGTVPGIQLNNFSNTPNSAVISIRGIGVVEPDPYAGNTVSIVYDGVPQFFSLGALVDLYDIQRIEVLRGPQGTLFGANTTGGVVNIVTDQPTGEWGGKFETSYGNYRHLMAAGAFDMPVVQDLLAAKFVFSHDQRDGFFRNVVDGQDYGHKNTTIVRGYLKLTPASNFEATLIGEYDRGRNGAPAFQIGGAGPEVGPTPNPNDGNATQQYPAETLYVPPSEKGYDNPCPSRFQQCHSTGALLSANDSVPDISNLNTYRGTLTMNWRDTLIGDLTSITGYKHFSVFEYTDQDQSPLFLDDTRRRTTGWQFSQELRTAAKISDAINIVAGGFYLKDHYHHEQDFRIQFAAPGLLQVNTQDQNNYSLSGFAQAYANVTDRLQLQAGVRYTHERTSMLAATLNSVNLSGTTDYDGTGNIALGGVAPPRGYKSWNNVGWKFGADYKITPTILGYASWARGFKSGGFTGRIGIASDLGPYNPEHVDTYEVGLKTDLFDRHLRVNVGGFYTNYRDLQIAQIYFVTDPTTGLPVQGNTILNAGSAHIKGFEAEATALLVRNLTLTGSLAYLDAKYAKFIYVSPFTVDAANPTGVAVDLKGNPLQNSPKWSATAGFTYDVPIGPNKLELHLLYSYTASKYLSSIDNSPRSKIQPTHMLDGNVDFITTKRFQVGFWGRNLLDKRYIQSVFDNVGYGGLVSYLNPREYGLDMKVQF